MCYRNQVLGKLFVPRRISIAITLMMIADIGMVLIIAPVLSYSKKLAYDGELSELGAFIRVTLKENVKF